MAIALTTSAEQMSALTISTAEPSKAVPTTFGLLARLLAAVAFALVLPVLARATALREGQGDIDVVGGELTDMSGHDLACFRVGEALQLVAVSALFVAAFVMPLFATASNNVVRALLWILGILLTAAGIGAWEGFTGTRAKGEERPPLSWWLGLPLVIALLALVVAAWAARTAIPT
jgi:formate hydrogenlyase subunit 4